jgi:hypothetical protein
LEPNLSLGFGEEGIIVGIKPFGFEEILIAGEGEYNSK